MKRVNETRKFNDWKYQFLGSYDDKGYPVGTKYDQKGNPVGTKYDKAGKVVFIPKWDDNYIPDWYDYFWIVPVGIVVVVAAAIFWVINTVAQWHHDRKLLRSSGV